MARSASTSTLTESIPHAVAGFLCLHCGGLVPEEAPGTRNRNHCPHCLSSIHVDIRPGDRRSLCRGRMEAIAIWIDAKGEARVIHRCTECGVLKSNRVAGDDDPSALRSVVDRSRSGIERNGDS
ncbi:MAG: RNHCP domain-containing protein [Spirochaetota bacterium]